MRLQRIVVGVDFRAPSLAAVQWVARRLAPEAELVLVHSIVLPEPPSTRRDDFPSRQELLAAAYDAAAGRLRELRRTLPGRRRDRIEICEGDPAEVIARVADAHGADLAVVGTHGTRPGPWDQLGSTAERLVQCSPVPVLLATGVLRDAPRRLLVPVQAEDIAEPVLEWARALEERFDARLALVHVEPAGEPAGAAAGPAHAVDMVDVDVVDVPGGATTSRWRALAAGGRPGSVFTDAAYGDPAEVILAEADRFGSDLIVLGEGALAAIRRRLADEVVDHVLRDAGCSVLVVMERDAR